MRHVSPIDATLARTVASSDRFGSDPIALYDSLVERFGPTRAEAIWFEACRLADAETAMPPAEATMPPATTAAELVGIGEIAELVGLTTHTIHYHRRRGSMPPPDFELNVGPVWKRETIEQWNRERNRKPGPPAELLEQWRESKTGAA
jgi:MerR HTH family regulatory protein